MKPLIIAICLTHTFDITTSIRAFNVGAVEQNPFVLSNQPTPFIAQDILTIGGELVIYNSLKKDHPRLAKALVIGQMVGSSMAGIQNIRVRRELEKK